MQVVGADLRCLAKHKPFFGDEDVFDLIARDQQQSASEQACPYLEQIWLIDAGTKAKPLDQTDPPRGRVDPKALAATQGVTALQG